MTTHRHLARPSRRIVLIDDDPAFGSIMSDFALSRGIQLDHYKTLEDMGSIGRLSDYAVAVVDYDLGNFNGVEIAEYLPVFFCKMPMILISGQNRESSDTKPWPDSIKEFVHKDIGPDRILDKALAYLPPLVESVPDLLAAR